MKPNHIINGAIINFLSFHFIIPDDSRRENKTKNHIDQMNYYLTREKE